MLRPIEAPRQRSGLKCRFKPEWSDSGRAESGKRMGVRKPLDWACRSVGNSQKFQYSPPVSCFVIQNQSL
ncbi:MAG TPA: hypothetical protein DCZ74_02825 [Treponema sp.]|nr:hypothetical protein [Treponema sp.]